MHEPRDNDVRWPGAVGTFALFGEVLWVGVLVCVTGALVITLPAALAAGSRHLRRYLAAEEASVRTFARDFRMALPGGLLVGLAFVVAIIVLLIDLALASAGIPGGPIVLAAGIVGLAGVGTVLVRAAYSWGDSAGWRSALSSATRTLRGDIVGTVYLVVALALLVLITWQLLPLVIPAVGCLVFASVAISERRRAVNDSV